MKKLITVHACWRDEQCRSLDCPPRLYVNTPLGSLIVGAGTQLYVPIWGMTMLWSPIVWHPRHRWYYWTRGHLRRIHREAAT